MFLIITKYSVDSIELFGKCPAYRHTRWQIYSDALKMTNHIWVTVGLDVCISKCISIMCAVWWFGWTGQSEGMFSVSSRHHWLIHSFFYWSFLRFKLLDSVCVQESK